MLKQLSVLAVVLFSVLGFAKTEGSVLCYNVSTKALEDPKMEKPRKLTERYCLRPTDCTTIVGTCGRCVLAVNKMEVKNVAASIAKQNAAANCLHGEPPKLEAKCVKRMCVVVDNSEPVPPPDVSPLPLPTEAPKTE